MDKTDRINLICGDLLGGLCASRRSLGTEGSLAILRQIAMPETKHEIIKWPKKVLYPVTRAPHAAAIEKAVSKVVAKMKPRSFCVCGRNCAVNRKHIATLNAKRDRHA